MVKIAVASAIQLAVFDGVKARLHQEQQWGREHPTAALLVSAMCAGLAVTAVVQPVDVITTRLWNQQGKAQRKLQMVAAPHSGADECAPCPTTFLAPKPRLICCGLCCAVVNGVGTLYRNAWECAAKTVLAEGPQALYKGCTAHFLRAGPHTVLTLLLLDRMQRALGLHPAQQPVAGGAKRPPLGK